MPGKWIKVPPKPGSLLIQKECDTEGCERKTTHEFCIECFRVKMHHLEFCDDCGACHEDVIEDCKQCKSVGFGENVENLRLCHAAECKHTWNALNYRKPVIDGEYRTKGCTCVTDGVHEKGRPCIIHHKAVEGE